jgi:hypothetical protein
MMTTPVVGDDERTWASREDYLADVERQRRELVAECRRYYAGEQYDDDNARCLQDWVSDMSGTGEKSLARRLFDVYQLPEHLRLHAYSTQLAEAVDWIADRLAEGFAVEASPKPVEQIITDCLNATPEFAAGDDDEERSVATVLREAGKAGDVPVLVRWDKVEGCCWLEFWDSEMVRMDFRDDRPDQLESVTVEHIDWRVVGGVTKQVTVRREWVLSDQDEGTGTARARRRCVERVFIISEGEKVAERPVAVHEWNTDVLPWGLVRAQRDNLRATRGSSWITVQAMRTADRYNAVEQVSWLIARYNSHGNMYVIGDAVMVQKDNEQYRVHKDVADVLTFPGGTAAGVITLPTDPQMIEHQKSTLVDAMYGRFGLVRTDNETVSNLGQVSGYALEILNEKSEGTFARVRSQLIKDFKALLNLVVDCHQAWSATSPDDDPEDLDLDTGVADDDLGTGTGGDTPDRKITVRLGSGWIVDIASARDDYVAGAISRREYLRIKGKGNDEIDDIEDEIAEEEQETQDRVQAALGESGRFTASGQAGGTVNDASSGRRNGSDVGVGSRV